MPFKSKAQLRKFFVLERQGKISKRTLREHLDSTPNIKKLPERLVKKSFAIGFEKIAKYAGIGSNVKNVINTVKAAPPVPKVKPFKPIPQIKGSTEAALDRYNARILQKYALDMSREAALEVVNMADRIPGTELRADAETGQARGQARRTFNVKNEDREFGQKFRRSADTARGGRHASTK